MRLYNLSFNVIALSANKWDLEVVDISTHFQIKVLVQMKFWSALMEIIYKYHIDRKLILIGCKFPLSKSIINK